jgi:hypothetical protein
MKRRAAAAVAFFVLLLPGVAEAKTYSVRYVVPPLQAPELSQDPAIAQMGLFKIVPSSTRVTVKIEDDVTPNGHFLFKICQKNNPDPRDSYCGEGPDDVSTGDICYAGPTTLRRVVPGNPVEVTLWWAPSPCPDAPVTGTLTVTG